MSRKSRKKTKKSPGKKPARKKSQKKPAAKKAVSKKTPAAKKPSEKKQAPKQKTAATAVVPLWRAYISLMRLDRPIGILLVLWPTLWSLWLAARGMPSLKNLVIFSLGCVLMRSAGCVINDYADRKIDGHVQRTKNRPIASGQIAPTEALWLFVILCAAAFILVMLTNPLTIKLSFGAVFLAALYPFTKRFTHMPQVFLGAAFAWSIPMAFAAETHEITPAIWLLYTAVIVWAVIYDTFYAMVDREDDLKIGVKSTAILFGEADKTITGLLQGLFILAMILAGRRFELGHAYYISLVGAGALFVYQQKLIQFRDSSAQAKNQCFKAFLNNNYVGLIIFIGIAASFYF